jgi:hypothetical protein
MCDEDADGCLVLLANDGVVCDDGDACTTGETCRGGVCTNGAALGCDDGNACTMDRCDGVDGCGHEPMPGCADADADGDAKPDEQDECTTTVWSPSPQTPPDQHPLGFWLVLRNLASPGKHWVGAKGFFNPAPSGSEVNPAANGVHVRIADEGGLLYDVSIPGGAAGSSACGGRDGWGTYMRPGGIVWKYRNSSGALPPSCEPGSAKGISRLQIGDRRGGSKRALEFKVLAEDTTLVGTPLLPVRRIQFDIALGAQPSQGEASLEAIAGLCAEALIIGNPVSEARPKPYCAAGLNNAALESISCEGL